MPPTSRKPPGPRSHAGAESGWSCRRPRRRLRSSRRSPGAGGTFCPSLLHGSTLRGASACRAGSSPSLRDRDGVLATTDNAFNLRFLLHVRVRPGWNDVITAIPGPSTLLSTVFTLDVDDGTQTIRLADSVPLGSLPPNGFAVLSDGSQVVSQPREITGLSLYEDKVSISWDSAASTAGNSTVHDVLRSSMRQLPVGGGPSETCLGSTSASITSDSEFPQQGEGFSYLVRGRNAAGTGTYGFQSNGTERITRACP